MHWEDGTFDELLKLVQTQAELIDVLRACSAQLDLNSLLQMVVDSATKITGASFGAFFHKGEDEAEGFMPYKLSGIDGSKFATFPPVRATKLFEPTFVRGEIVRLGDVREELRFAKNEPFKGLPAGHPPVVSYMAVPVMARGGGIFGALLFSHIEPNKFTLVHETAVTAIAAQASVALENALLYKQAQEAVRVREDFLSIAAHEIRTPLTPLTLQLQFMQQCLKRIELSGRNEQVATKSLDISVKQVQRLTRLVDELLDVSRIRVGKFKLNCERVDLVEIVRDLTERYQNQAAEVGSLIVIDAVQEPIFVMVDRFRIQQVVVNLIANALKYAPGTQLEITLFQNERNVYMRFKDSGPGIPIEDQERIFNRFERADRDVKRGGLGLGLYLGREIIEAHNGTIEVASEPGAGCTFAITIPHKNRGNNNE